ncbi:MAG: MsnO8 family LLM class oxidoreductase, partial [Acidimicrobiales bacterium]
LLWLRPERTRRSSFLGCRIVEDGAMQGYLSTLRLSVLDQSPISAGSDASDALQNSIDLATHVDALGFHRYWVAEHHNSRGLAGAAPEIMIGQIANVTSQIRVGSGGVMLSHYAPFKVAETFRTLATLYPGRIDLGVGRAPGSDPITAYALAAGNRPRSIDLYPTDLRDLNDWLRGETPMLR